MKIALEKNSGITLIALVVTIIVLLILASVSISVVLGDNGLIEMAKNAADKTNEAVKKDLDDIQNITGQLNNFVNPSEPPPEVTPEKQTIKVELTVDEAKASGTEIPVSVTKIMTENNETKTIDDNNFTYEWSITNEPLKNVNGTSKCTFSNLEEEKTYTIKCLVTDKTTGEIGTGEVTVLSFQVVDGFYRGTEGMTWKEWINSNYVKTFPLNKEHYEQFLKECGWDGKFNLGGVDTQFPGSVAMDNKPPYYFYDYYTACGIGLFAIDNGSTGRERCAYCCYLTFHASEEDLTLIPESPRDHLRIFVDIQESYESFGQDGYFDSIEAFRKGPSCVAEGTLITLADGSKVPVENLNGDEKVLVWNFYSGKYEASDIAFIVNHNEESKERRIIHAYFSDGTDIEIIKDHGFFDLDLNKFVLIDEANYKDYIGDWFVKESLNGDKQHEKVQLTDVKIESRVCRVYEVITPKNLTCFTNGLLSVSSLLDTFCNIFEVDRNTLTYDKELMEKDIEKYGLFGYDEYEGKLSYEAFEMLNLRYMKVALGKGIITEKHRLYLRTFFNDNSANFKSKFDL